ncbi:hypothetical protein Tco_0653110 [Tanacetum coccineum]|uniref:Uncharacterized protein n=1 Tax=Tanacetum coccineum TaxID=301880 RepID=A0ABQ4WZH8_9ASTR
MHANDHHDNVVPANYNSLVHDNSALEQLKHENDRLIELLLSQDLMHTAVNSLAAINDYKSMEKSFVDEYEENSKLQTELANKNDMIEKAEFFTINDLHAQLEAKNVLVVKLKEHIANIKGKNVVENVQNVHNSDVITSKVKPQEKQTTNNSVLPSTRVSCFTEASGSKPRSNTKNDRILQTSSSNKKKNKVEDHPRIAKSSLNNLNRISKSVYNLNVQQSVLNANSQLICATCNECMFDSIHDSCVCDYLVDMNACVKCKSVKPRNAKSKKKKT